MAQDRRSFDCGMRRGACPGSSGVSGEIAQAAVIGRLSRELSLILPALTLDPGMAGLRHQRSLARGRASDMVSLPGINRTDSRRGASGRGGQIPDPRNVPAEEWDPSGLVRLALEFGCQLINNQRSPLGCD